MALIKVERLRFLTEGRTLGQAAIQYVLFERTVASVLPNIYDSAQLREFATYNQARPFTEAEYEQVQTMCERNFDLERTTA